MSPSAGCLRRTVFKDYKRTKSLRFAALQFLLQKKEEKNMI